MSIRERRITNDILLRHIYNYGVKIEKEINTINSVGTFTEIEGGLGMALQKQSMEQ